MTQRREIKQRSQKVWDAVRKAYLAGEPGASVARRFDVGYGNLRYKAVAEGWTRKAHMAAEAAREAEEEALAAGAGPLAMDGTAPPELGEAAAEDRTDPLARANALLEQGRAAEALALVRASEALNRATGVSAPSAATRGLDAELAAAHARIAELETTLAGIQRDKVVELFTETENRAAELAQQMLRQRCYPLALHAVAAFHWRARVLGPEVAAADRAHALDSGWSHGIWAEDGRLKPLQESQSKFAETMERFVREAEVEARGPDE